MVPGYSNPLYIGGKFDGTNELDGKIAEFVVWNCELSEEEVAAVYNSSLAGETEEYFTVKGGYRDIESNTIFDDNMVTPTAKQLAGIQVSTSPITDAGE